MGIRAHCLRFADGDEENTLSCAVTRVIQDVFSTIVLLRPDGASPDAPLLRMELDKAAWQAVPDKSRVTVSIPPEEILLLK
jgi:molybdate transport system ATP-binding protein